MESSSDVQAAAAAAAAPTKDHSDSKENRSEPCTERHHGRAPSRSRSGSRSRGLRRSSRTRSSRDQQLDGDDHHRHHEDGARSGADHQHHRRGGDRSRSRSRGDSRRRRRSRSQGRRRSRSLDRYGGESSRRHADHSRSRSQRRVKRRSVSLNRLDESRKHTSTGARSASDRRSTSWNGERTSEYRERDHRDWDDRHRRQPSRSRDRSSGRQPRRRRDRRGGRRRRGRRQDHQQQQPNDPEQQVAENGDLPESPNNQRHNGRHGGGERQPRRRSKISIPDNWEDVAKMGDLIRDSRFLPMRCPLDDKFTHLYESPDHAWSPKLFVQEQESKGHNVRMVIDLTNTFKYYDGSAEFEGTSIEYVKLKIEGFNAPPREDEVAKFMTIVDAFLEKEPEGSIAVHCTHGLNRTGYLIVNYLVKKLGCTVKHALESFSLARPPGLIKHMYVEALYRNLGEGEELELPVLPDWAADKYSKRR